MKGVDVGRYRFDFDLTFAVLFLNRHGRVLGRFGGRDAGGAEGRISVAALEKAMERALVVHAAEKDLPPRIAPGEPRTPMDGPSAESFWSTRKDPECVHCHTVYDVERDLARRRGTWDKREAYRYPLPENVGLTLDVDEGDLVTAVAPDSPAAAAGLLAGDARVRMGDQPILSQADVQHVLDGLGWTGAVDVVLRRDGRERTTRLEVDGDWRVTDIGWRGSMWSIEPNPRIHAVALGAERRGALAIADGRMAFEARWIPAGPSRAAGVRQGDVIVAVDGDRTDVPWSAIQVRIRMERSTDDVVVLTLLRDGREVEARLRFE